MSQTRQIAVKIQKITGQSLVSINLEAYRFIEMGLVTSELEAYEYMAKLVGV